MDECTPSLDDMNKNENDNKSKDIKCTNKYEF